MTNKKRKTLIIGLSRLGSSIAKELCENGEDVIVLDKNENSFNKLSDSFSGYTIKGDGTDYNVLKMNHISEMDQVLITTEDDNTNIYISHLCFFLFDLPKIYIRLSDNDKSKLIENTSIKAIYPFLLSKNEFNKLKGE